MRRVSDRQRTQAGESWNLSIEPTLIVVDSPGVIAGRFEGTFGMGEVESVLLQVLGAVR